MMDAMEPSSVDVPKPKLAGGRGASALEYSIRPACVQDAPAILAMIQELAAFEHLADELTVTAESLQASLFGPAPVASALVAAAQGQLVGYAIYFWTFSSFVGKPGIFVDDLYVRVEHRRQGIGTALLQEMARLGVKNNTGRLEWIALKWNKRALALYAKLGMRAMDEWTLLRIDQTGMQRIAMEEGAC